MAIRETTCDIEMFAKSLEELLGTVPDECANGCERAVRKAVVDGAKELRGEKTAGIGRHPWSDEYRHGFKSHVERAGLATEGEVGNASKPGLVHLLEKGHATLHGRRTGTFRHMAPTFEEMKDEVVELVGKYVVEELQ